MRKFCLGGFALLKFKPEVFQLFTLVLGQKSENSVCRPLFPFVLSLFTLLVLAIGVACVNFYYIVKQKHCHGFENIYFFIGIFA